MTREHKLALLIGFALVLIVGVVVSDHFSGARSARLGEVVDEREEQRRPIGGGLATRQELRTPDPLPANHGVSEIEFAMEAPTVEPDRIVSGARTSSGSEALIEALRGGLERLDGYTIDMGRAPTAVQTDRRRSEATESPAAALPEEPKGPERWGAARIWPDPQLHHVQAGETLWSIAERRYGDGAMHTRLAEYNRDRMTPSGVLRVGATLLIPVRNELLAGAAAPEPGAQAATPRTEPAADTTSRHTVQRGETLGEISQKLLGTSRRWREIHQLNQDVIDNPDHVPAGVVLRIPAR